jgi:hypothetical protein
MTEKMIIDAYCRIRTIDNTIPDDVLDFMKDAAIEKLRKHAVSSTLPVSSIPEFGSKEWVDCCEQMFGGKPKNG